MDINILNVAKLIFNDISSRFFNETPVTAEEIELKDRIIEVIESYVKSTPVFFKCDPYLEMSKHESEIEFEEESPNESEDEIDSYEEMSGRSTPEYGKQRTEVSFDEKKRAVEYWESGKKGRLNWKTVANSFRFVKSSRQLYRFKKQIIQRGWKEHKKQIIWDFTLNKLKSAREQNITVNDSDVRRWALEKNSEVQLDTFKASKIWIQKIKRHFRTCIKNENL